MTGASSQIIRFTYLRPAMPDDLAVSERTRVRRPNATYLLVVFVLFALVAAAALPDWLVTPTPADPAASAPGDGTAAALTDDVTGLITAAEGWLESFAAQDAEQLDSAAGDVTRRAEQLGLSLSTRQEPPRTRAAGSAGHLRAALAYLEAGLATADPVAVDRARDLLRLAGQLMARSQSV